MNRQTPPPDETETSASDIGERHTELASQHWDRAKSLALAEAEGIAFSDDHCSVILFMRKYYLEHRLPINARTTARAMNRQFSNQGGSRYLRQLFSEGPVAQGSRLARLRMPPTTRLAPPVELVAVRHADAARVTSATGRPDPANVFLHRPGVTQHAQARKIQPRIEETALDDTEGKESRQAGEKACR